MSSSRGTTNRPRRLRRWPRVVRKVDRFVGRREAGIFRLLGHFLPDTSVARSRRFQHLVFAKALAEMARDATKYAALVAVVVTTGSAFQSSLMTVATLVPAALFGLYAGEVADSLPKRIAIASAYGLASFACFLIPTVFGTDVPEMFALVFVVSAFSQLASPAENSAVPLVANEQQLASATSMMGLASSIGTAAGTAFLAPVLLKLTSASVVFYVSGVLLLVAATRVMHVYSKRDRGTGGFVRPRRATNARALRWLFQHPSISTMVGVSVLTGVSNVIMTTLAPTYVHEVLGADPTNTVYIMGGTGVAMTLSLFVAPFLIGHIGERVTAALGFGLVVVSLTALGLVDANIAAIVDPVNALRVAGVFGIAIPEDMRTAVALSFPLGLGVGLTDNSVKTYINRRVPFAFQGRTFAVRSTLEHALAIVPLLTVSGIASLVGVSFVLVLTPVTIYLLLLALLWVGSRYGMDREDPKQAVTRTFWQSSDDVFEEDPSVTSKP